MKHLEVKKYGEKGLPRKKKKKKKKKKKGGRPKDGRQKESVFI